MATLSMADVKNRMRARAALGRCQAAMMNLQRGVEQLASAELVAARLEAHASARPARRDGRT